MGFQSNVEHGRYVGPNAVCGSRIVRLLREFGGRPEASSRLLAAQYANTIFTTDHLPSRFVCILAAGDPSADVRMEA